MCFILSRNSVFIVKNFNLKYNFKNGYKLFYSNLKKMQIYFESFSIISLFWNSRQRA